MKKGDMSMNVIIGAVIALLVLVVISYLIINAFINTEEGLECDKVIDGGQCVDAESCGELGLTPGSGECEEGFRCCGPPV